MKSANNSTDSLQTLDDWLDWLQTLSPREIVLGLERVEVVLERMAIPRPPLVITVAGTNGKGSCVAMLESILRRAGASTGCYTSPHLNRYNERMRVDGRPLDDAAVISALQQVENVRFLLDQIPGGGLLAYPRRQARCRQCDFAGREPDHQHRPGPLRLARRGP